MKMPVMMFACLCVFHGEMVSAQLFGGAPKTEAAITMKDRMVAVYRTQGVDAGIKMLDSEGRAFFKKAGATGRYDFLEQISNEASTGSGREDLKWGLALTEWCYRFTLTNGEGYWLRYLTPTMHECYFDVGNYSAARAVIERERTSKLEGGKELDVTKLKTVGPLDPEFPAIGKKTLGNLERIGTKDFGFFVSQAQQDLVEGKWHKAMEAAALGSEHALDTSKWYQGRPNLVDSKPMVSNMTFHWRRSKIVSADGYRFLGLQELELKTLDELSNYNPDEPEAWNEVLMGRCRALLLNHQLGKKGDEVIGTLSGLREELKKVLISSKEDADRVDLMIADIYFRQGNAKRGWEIINEVRAKQGQSRDMKFEVDREWSRQRVNTGKTDEVEPVLVNLLTIAREGGLKQREIELYEIYAQLLVALGRYDDALVIQQELLRLLKSFDLFPRVPSALRYLAEIHSLLGDRDKAAKLAKEAQMNLASARVPDAWRKRLDLALGQALPAASDQRKSEEATTDLQPLKAMMIPLEGLPARGLFTLTNLSGRNVEGILRFNGQGLSFRESEVGMVELDVARSDGQAELSRQVMVAAGDFIAINLSTIPSAGASASKVAINWQPNGGKIQSAEWSAEDAEKGVSVAITDAAEYLDNPFYLIPVYHLLQYKDSFAEVADMRVVASAPARIELYDQSDELVFVDADGDGAFDSEGDMVSKDRNRNAIGDLAMIASSQEMRFRIFVRPLKINADQDLLLDLQLLEQGEWVTHSTDRIVFPKPEK